MKKEIKHLLTAILMLVLAVSMLTGCSAKPKPEDAQMYVKAVLDVICTGDYDHSVTLADVEEGKETEFRDQMIDESLSALTGEADLSDEIKDEYKQIMIDALALAKYNVGDAKSTEDGGYDVTVSIEPFRLYDSFNDNFEETLTEKVMEDTVDVLAMSDDEKRDYVMKVIMELLKGNIDDPKYDKAEDVTVHYGPIDEDTKVYGCTAEEGKKLGDKLFSLEGLQ